jgi:hypothetical protein
VRIPDEAEVLRGEPEDDRQETGGHFLLYFMFLIEPNIE